MEISMKQEMDLSVLFRNPLEVDWSSISDTFSEGCENEFKEIIRIRESLFRMEPFIQIIRDMMEDGIIPASAAIPAKYTDFKGIYDRLSSAEVRLLQVRKYLDDSKNICRKNSYMYGNVKAIQVLPPQEWII